MAKKRWLTNQEFRGVQARLDDIGIQTCINNDIVDTVADGIKGWRRNVKAFQLSVNLEIQEIFLSRESARRRIVKLYNHHYPSQPINIRKYVKNVAGRIRQDGLGINTGNNGSI